jgi:hypothetical protein
VPINYEKALNFSTEKEAFWKLGRKIFPGELSKLCSGSFIELIM